jgi:hypothetical protein
MGRCAAASRARTFARSAGPSGRQLTAKSTYSPVKVRPAGFPGADEMQDIQTNFTTAMPSIVPCEIPAMTDDECLLRLAHAVEQRDSDHLEELAMLIGRLVVTIE